MQYVGNDVLVFLFDFQVHEGLLAQFLGKVFLQVFGHAVTDDVLQLAFGVENADVAPQVIDHLLGWGQVADVLVESVIPGGEPCDVFACGLYLFFGAVVQHIDPDQGFARHAEEIAGVRIDLFDNSFGCYSDRGQRGVVESLREKALRRFQPAVFGFGFFQQDKQFFAG